MRQWRCSLQDRRIRQPRRRFDHRRWQRANSGSLEHRGAAQRHRAQRDSHGHATGDDGGVWRFADGTTGRALQQASLRGSLVSGGGGAVAFDYGDLNIEDASFDSNRSERPRSGARSPRQRGMSLTGTQCLSKSSARDGCPPESTQAQNAREPMEGAAPAALRLLQPCPRQSSESESSPRGQRLTSFGNRGCRCAPRRSHGDAPASTSNGLRHCPERPVPIQ